MESVEDENHELEDKKAKDVAELKKKELGIACMLSTEVGAVLAVIRRFPDPSSQFISSLDDLTDTPLIHSLKSLRVLIFNPQQEWRMIDPSCYLNPFLDVIQSEDVPTSATALSLSALLKILRFDIFDDKTPGAKEAINSVVTGMTNCRMEGTDPHTEEAVLMRVLQLLLGIMKAQASTLLTNHAVCTVVNTSFQLVQRTMRIGDLLQRNARYTMQELIQIVFARLPHIEVTGGENGELDPDNAFHRNDLNSQFGVRCIVDIFRFLCSLLNVVNVVETEGATSHRPDEDVQVFALVLINSALDVSGNEFGKHPKLAKLIQDDLFHHLIHYALSSGPLVVSMICSTVLSIYHYLRRSIRLQLEAFFIYVLFQIATAGNSVQRKEVVLEGLINFCRQPTFSIEAYVNYDCDPLCQNIFEDTMRLLCRNAFPASIPLTGLQVQAFEGIVTTVHTIADSIDKEEAEDQDDSKSMRPYLAEVSTYIPFWEEKSKDDVDSETWVSFVRVRKAQKRKLVIAGDHFNRDEKKGFEYLKFSQLVSDPADPKAIALFLRYTPRLDRQMIGEYLGDPDEFHLEVLKEFSCTFNFTGMILDVALRTFLKSFRLPGESQKIQRILEAFADNFYSHDPEATFANKDVVLILSYSVIMLNTDQHNPQVKKKMTEEEFIRNNRNINDGKDLPRELLSELFQSIASNPITVFTSSGMLMEMNPNRWVELMNRSKTVNPFVLSDFDRHLGRDMFASIAGPTVATLCAIFEHADDEEILHECIEGLFSVARISKHGLVDTLDEILASFCKFTTLLNPYVTAEETIYVFSNDVKPRMAILAVFTIANNFENSIRGGWRNIVDCLLKLKRLKLLPQSVVEPDPIPTTTTPSHNNLQEPSRSESGIIFPNHDPKFGSSKYTQASGLMGRFSHFLSIESSMEDSLSLGGSDFEQNVKIIQQCRIGNIFINTGTLPLEPLLNLGRSLIFAAAGKGQKFSTPIEEEETVGFCWDLVTTISLANTHRFLTFWPSYHDYLLSVAQFPLFSPIPFAEKAIVGLLKICLKLLNAHHTDNRLSEELIFKSINLMWKLEKEILDTCYEFIAQTVSKIIKDYPGNVHGQLGWKTILHLLSITGRHPETYDQAVDTLIAFMSDGSHVSQSNYPYCIECAFGFVALKNSPLEKNLKILELMSESVNLLIQWCKNGQSETGSNNHSSSSSSSLEDSRGSGCSGGGYPNITISLFVKLGESLRKTSLARREEIRNLALSSLRKSFSLAKELEFSSTSCMSSFNLVIFAMVDDLHEKMLEYSRRENAEREMRSMEGTLELAMELLTDVFLQFLDPIAESPGFRTFWLGVLRRMDTCMKAELGAYGASKLQELVPGWLRKMITTMKEKDILAKKEGDDLWDITYIQIQWIAPPLKEELFPEEM